MKMKDAVKISKILFLLFVLLFFLSVITNLILIYQNMERSRVAKVVDGDSFQTKDGRRIRLLGIDAPEKDNCFGNTAGEKLKDLLLGKRVRLKNTVTDDYGRLLANVIVEDFPTWINYMRYWTGKNITGRENKDLFAKIDPMANRVMVREGLARFVYVKSQYYEVLKQAAQEARNSQKGIYSAICRTESPNIDCLIKGNIRNGKQKIYHLPNCPNYDQIIIDEAYGDRWFCTEDEAVKEGFRKVSGC